MNRETLESLLVVGSVVKIGKKSAKETGRKEGEILTLVEGYFEYDNGNYCEEQIESLQEELGNCSLNDDRENMEYELLNEIKKEEKSLAYYTEKQKEYNINSKSYAENAEYIKKIEDRIKLLSNLTAPSVEQGKESTDISSGVKNEKTLVLHFDSQALRERFEVEMEEGTAKFIKP